MAFKCIKSPDTDLSLYWENQAISKTLGKGFLVEDSAKFPGLSVTPSSLDMTVTIPHFTAIGPQGMIVISDSDTHITLVSDSTIQDNWIYLVIEENDYTQDPDISWSVVNVASGGSPAPPTSPYITLARVEVPVSATTANTATWYFNDGDWLSNNDLPGWKGQSSSTPSSAKVSLGDVYFNTTDNTWYGWDGSAWIDLGAAGTSSFALDHIVRVGHDTLHSDYLTLADAVSFVNSNSTDTDPYIIWIQPGTYDWTGTSVSITKKTKIYGSGKENTKITIDSISSVKSLEISNISVTSGISFSPQNYSSTSDTLVIKDSIIVLSDKNLSISDTSYDPGTVSYDLSIYIYNSFLDITNTSTTSDLYPISISVDNTSYLYFRVVDTNISYVNSYTGVSSALVLLNGGGDGSITDLVWEDVTIEKGSLANYIIYNSTITWKIDGTFSFDSVKWWDSLSNQTSKYISYIYSGTTSSSVSFVDSGPVDSTNWWRFHLVSAVANLSSIKLEGSPKVIFRGVTNMASSSTFSDSSNVLGTDTVTYSPTAASWTLALSPYSNRTWIIDDTNGNYPGILKLPDLNYIPEGAVYTIYNETLAFISVQDSASTALDIIPIRGVKRYVAQNGKWSIFDQLGGQDGTDPARLGGMGFGAFAWSHYDGIALGSFSRAPAGTIAHYIGNLDSLTQTLDFGGYASWSGVGVTVNVYQIYHSGTIYSYLIPLASNNHGFGTFKVNAVAFVTDSNGDPSGHTVVQWDTSIYVYWDSTAAQWYVGTVDGGTDTYGSTINLLPLASSPIYLKANANTTSLWFSVYIPSTIVFAPGRLILRASGSIRASIL